ncbi:hypothetical protein EG68_04626 [Paragonimus skrjabini miyazakii]|uniref:Uncharacterized protein n=1 Tax=Paragonimus skrjabini miyazakii TaxID=59628 RepID=A0A8S9YYG0_9TREM|nr:hypothetical protein EG68_04626 [Paragonimus skrjabini miyazakii]
MVRMNAILLLILSSQLTFVLSIKCRTCLPCDEENKKRFIFRPEAIQSDCKVCVTAESEYAGYKMEGRACMQTCPTSSKLEPTAPGIQNNVACCYKDMCNCQSKRGSTINLFHLVTLVSVITWRLLIHW